MIRCYKDTMGNITARVLTQQRGQAHVAAHTPWTDHL